MNVNKILLVLFSLALGSSLFAESVIEELLPPYLQIRAALARDSVKEVPQAANRLASVVGSSLQSEKKDPRLVESLKKIESAVRGFKDADVKAGREAFKDLSKSLIEIQKTTPSKNATVFHCPMAKAYWMQQGDVAENPYLGKDMTKCGTKVNPNEVK